MPPKKKAAAERPSTKADNASTTSTTKKTKKSSLAEQRALAKQLYDQKYKEQDSSTKKRKVIEADEPKEPKKKDETHVSSPPKKRRRQTTTPADDALSSRMSSNSKKADSPKTSMIAATSPVVDTNNTSFTSEDWARAQGHRLAATKRAKKSLSPYNRRSLPSKASSPAVASPEPANAQRRPPTQDELRTIQSQQTSRRDSSTAMETEHSVQIPEVISGEIQDLTEDTKESSSDAVASSGWKSWFIFILALVGVVGSVAWALVTQPSSGILPLNRHHLTSDKLSDKCYATSPEYLENDSRDYCSSVSTLPCPSYAKCSKGKIVECNSQYLELLQQYNRCQFSPHYQEIVQLLRDKLNDYNVREYCEPTTGTNTKATGNTLHFSYTELVGELETGYDLELLAVANELYDTSVFIVDVDASSLEHMEVYVGLDSSQEIRYPLTCIMAKRIARFLDNGYFVVFSTVSFLFQLLQTASYTIFELIYRVWKYAPWPTCYTGVVGFVSVWFLVSRRNSQRRTKQLKIDISVTREEVLSYLELHATVRPKIAMEVREDFVVRKYPPGKSTAAQRKYFRDHVWPGVCEQLVKSPLVVHSQARDSKNEMRVTWKYAVPGSTA